MGSLSEVRDMMKDLIGVKPATIIVLAAAGIFFAWPTFRSIYRGLTPKWISASLPASIYLGGDLYSANYVHTIAVAFRIQGTKPLGRLYARLDWDGGSQAFYRWATADWKNRNSTAPPEKQDAPRVLPVPPDDLVRVHTFNLTGDQWKHFNFQEADYRLSVRMIEDNGREISLLSDILLPMTKPQLGCFAVKEGVLFEPDLSSKRYSGSCSGNYRAQPTPAGDRGGASRLSPKASP